MTEWLSTESYNLDKYRVICKQLESLGYKYPLTPDTYLPLLEKLVNDVLTQEEELEQYKLIIKKVKKEKYNLERGLKPYQEDNERLALENSDLQEELFQLQEKNEKLQKEFEKEERANKLKVADLKFICKITFQKLKALETNNKSLSLAFKSLIIDNKDVEKKDVSIILGKLQPYIDQAVLKNNLLLSSIVKDEYIVNGVLGKMDRETAEMLEELEDLKLDNQHQSDIIVALKCQIAQKDREVNRMKHMLEGGKSLSVVNQDCCLLCLQKDSKVGSLEKQLREAVDKQHEAMSRALHLAEKNQLLERELKDIDNIALAVEKECENKVKNNLKNIDVVEEKLRQKNIEIQRLEETILNMKNRIERNKSEFDDLKREKQILEKNLQAEMGEKKQLNDKINCYLLIEKKLNSEIARMQEINKSLHRQLFDMESRVMDLLGTSCKGYGKGIQKRQNFISGLKSTSTVNAQISSTKSLCKAHLHDEEKNEYVNQNFCMSLFDKLQQERDFYHNECHRLKDQLGTLTCSTDNSLDLIKQVKELEKEIIDLKQDNFSLRRENSIMIKRLDFSEHLSGTSGDSLKIILDRLEKERDLALSDISRLQGERDALKERIKLATESHLGEQSRFEKIIKDNEDRIRRLETERRELISSQSAQRVSLATMEEKCDEYKENMRKAQSELAQMKTNYYQLKSLQEKTDLSLTEVQGRLSQTEIDLRGAATKIQELGRVNSSLENEISILKKDKTDLMSSITFIEKEKDGLLITLDEKTEKVVKMEGHIKKQEVYTSELMEKITHLEKKLEFVLSEKTNREYAFRNLEREADRLKEELAQCELQKEALIRENGRLQDDLSSAAKDCISSRRELDTEKKDVENLKKQLQQYVLEVKKAEELLTKKEAERNQMLEHFRSLSIEATTLETSNHTLESTVENTKTQLISASNRITDLEHQIASKETLLYSYEKQIAELTTQVAELESKLKQQTEMRLRVEEDLSALRELCSTLDGQKEALKELANNRDAEKIQLMNEVRRLSEEYDGLNQKLTHERSLSQTLEKSLCNSRQETLEHKITNKDLQMHVHHLQQKVDELMQKLESESQNVRRYQAQCSELSQQVSELRREVTNARFEQARTKEDCRRTQVQCFQEEESKDVFFEGKSLENSSRTVPPLNFPEDSDRTMSLDSESENLNFLLTSENSCNPDSQLLFNRKPFWALSPVEEKREGKSETNTASEWSSIPEENGKSVNPASIPSDDRTEPSAYPTYSVRDRLYGDNVEGKYDLCNEFVVDRIGSYTTEDLHRIESTNEKEIISENETTSEVDENTFSIEKI